MKLLDLLAMEVAHWPHSVGRMYQTEDGYIIASGGWGDSWYWSHPGIPVKAFPIVEDRDTALVTKGKWEAEVNRLKRFFDVEY